MICDSKSGVSGAGKKSDLAYSFAELSGNFKAYGVGTHRHEPEMRQELGIAADAPFVFVPHLLPAVRGILSTIHVAFTHAPSRRRLSGPPTRVVRRGAVRPRAAGGRAAGADGRRRHAAREIGFALLPGGRRAVLVSVIDNLLKGAASQAVQNINRVCGFAETEGLR